MVSSFTSGVSEGLPDIVLMDDYDVQNYLLNYEGKFAELSEDIDFDKFAPYKVTNATYQEGVYAVPFDSGSAGLYYRKDYLSEAGIDESELTNLTWSKFVEIGETVKEKRGNGSLRLFQIAALIISRWRCSQPDYGILMKTETYFERQSCYS